MSFYCGLRMKLVVREEMRGEIVRFLETGTLEGSPDPILRYYMEEINGEAFYIGYKQPYAEPNSTCGDSPDGSVFDQETGLWCFTHEWNNHGSQRDAMHFFETLIIPYVASDIWEVHTWTEGMPKYIENFNLLEKYRQEIESLKPIVAHQRETLLRWAAGLC